MPLPKPLSHLAVLVPVLLLGVGVQAAPVPAPLPLPGTLLSPHSMTNIPPCYMVFGYRSVRPVVRGTRYHQRVLSPWPRAGLSGTDARGNLLPSTAAAAPRWTFHDGPSSTRRR